MFEITVKLDSDAIEAAVRHAWQKEFLVPDRYGNVNGGVCPNCNGTGSLNVNLKMRKLYK